MPMVHLAATTMSRRQNLLCVGVLLVAAIVHGRTAAAETFSVRCGEASAGAEFNYTFDDVRKRVIAYNFLGDRISSLIFKGTIRQSSPDNTQFALVVASNPAVKVGEFRLNRQEGWLTSSRSNYEAKQACETIPTRSVMDLWVLFENSK
jgi:hypothetical protein